jgi:hypothetical protein
MVRAISTYAGLLVGGLAAGAVVATIFVMGWALYVVGALAAFALVAALLMFVETVDAKPYDRERARRLCWGATIAAVVLTVVFFAA